MRLLTGNAAFDVATGGLPLRGIFELSGGPSSGKSAVVKMLLKRLPATTRTVLYCLDGSIEATNGYVDVSGSSCEAALCLCLESLREGAVVILDPLAMVTAKSKADSADSRLVGAFLLHAQEMMAPRSSLFLTNQRRLGKGTMSVAYATTVEHLVPCRARMIERDLKRREDNELVGKWVELDVYRNREFAASASIRMLVRDGKLRHSEGIIDAAHYLGRLFTEGSQLTIRSGGIVVSGRGRQGLANALIARRSDERAAGQPDSLYWSLVRPQP